MSPAPLPEAASTKPTDELSARSFPERLRVIRAVLKRRALRLGNAAASGVTRPFRGLHGRTALPYNAREFESIRRAFDISAEVMRRPAPPAKSPPEMLAIRPEAETYPWDKHLEEALRLTMLRAHPRWIVAQLLQPALFPPSGQRCEPISNEKITKVCGEHACLDARAWYEFKAKGRLPSGWPKRYSNFFSEPTCGFGDKGCRYSNQDWDKVRQAWQYTVRILSWKWRSSHPTHQTPAIAHAMQVAMILAQARQSCELLIAGLLHDAQEDVQPRHPKVMNEIQEAFGPRVRELVERVSEPRATPEDTRRHLDVFFGRKYFVLGQCRTRQSATLLAASKISTLEDGIRFVEAWGKAGVLKWSRGDFTSNIACLKTTATHLQEKRVPSALRRVFASRLKEFKKKAKPYNLTDYILPKD